MKSKLYLDQYLLVNVVSIVFLLILEYFWYLQLQLNPKEFIQIVFT